MFLRNLWSKYSQQQLQLNQYDKITFDININDNIPEFSDQSKISYSQEFQLTPDHPLYYEIFATTDKPEETQIYVTNEQDDSISGLALKFNISEEAIRKLNNISSETLFPNMRINIPLGVDVGIQQMRTTDKKQKISELFPHLIEKSISKYDVCYCVGSGNIIGTLTLNSSYIMFNPNIDDYQNKNIFGLQKLLKYFVIIEMEDIKEILTMDLAEMTQEEIPTKSHIIQLLLYRVGNKKIEEKFKERLKILKGDSKAIASISFKIPKENQEAQVSKKNEIASKITEMIKCAAVNGESQKQGLTNIPYFDILYENITKKEPLPEVQHQMKRKRSPSLVTAKLNQQSMLPHDAFTDLVSYMPVIDQLCNWSLVYSCLKNGTSFKTLLRLCSGKRPLLLMIKEYKGNMFGAYIVESLEHGKTGRGEMFIWKYDTQKNVVTAYDWTQKNNFFCFLDSDGLGIGMGSKYGIWIKNTLERGASAETDTFGNKQRLSVRDDFEIENVEVWEQADDQY